MVATVERMTSDGHYDLDIKKSADPKNMAPFTTEALIEKEERAGALNLRDGAWAGLESWGKAGNGWVSAGFRPFLGGFPRETGRGRRDLRPLELFQARHGHATGLRGC